MCATPQSVDLQILGLPLVLGAVWTVLVAALGSAAELLGEEDEDSLHHTIHGVLAEGGEGQGLTSTW